MPGPRRLPAPGLLPLLAALTAACHGAPAPAPAAPAAAAAPGDDTAPRGRLDDRVRPTSYSLELTVDPAATGFTGQVAIEVVLARPTQVIWLHARGLELGEITIRAGAKPRPAHVVADPRTDHSDGQAELVGLAVDAALPAGPATIAISYRGTYGDKVGLIKTQTEPPYIYSDLEPIDARAMMPCFDDPRWKTPWRVSLVVPSALLAVANGPERRRAAVDATHTRVEFAPTRPLPSYLVAVAVGDLEATPAPGGPVPLRILTPRGLGPTTAVAAAALPALVANLAGFLGEPLPLAKLDVLVIPYQEDATKGMENPGLITLVAKLVLADPTATGRTASRAREEIVHGLAHEVAHQWFGDLITIDDWGALWLQEGGATWLGTRAARELLGPTWSSPFEVEQLDSRLKDGRRAPIAAAIQAPADPGAMFRIETYAGGAAVFEALEAWLGADRLQSALHALLAAHRDGHYDPAALVAAIGGDVAPTHADLGAAIAAMTAATRMPTVTAIARCAAKGSGTTISDVTVEVTVDDPAPLPVCVDVAGSMRTCGVIRGHGTLASVAMTCPRWILPNPGGGAPYRRAWPPGALAAVLAVPHPAADELAIARELRGRFFARPRVELAPHDLIAADAFLAASALSSPMITNEAVRELDALWRAAPDAAARDRVAAAITEAVAARPLPFVDDGRDAATAILARWLASRGDFRLRKAALAEVPDLVATVTAGTSMTGEVVLARAAAGTAGEFDALRRRVLAPKPPWLAYRALGAFQLPDIVARLRAVLTSPKVPPSGAMVLLATAARNPVAWPHLAELAALRHDLAPRDRVELAGLTCDAAHAAPLLAGIAPTTDGGNGPEDLAAGARDTLARCAEVRAAWPADL